MPLGTRDVLLAIRAKDQASRVLADVGRNFSKLDEQGQEAAKHLIGTGTALLGAGVAVTAMGIAGVDFLHAATKEAIEFNRQAALTLTQVDDTSIKLEDLKQVAKDVGATVPVPFKELQTTLYDIFSSMDVNLQESQTLLDAFSHAAVAGQADLQDAARASIAVLNAYALPASEVNRVLDVQFQLVRKGVGTYQEFSESIGKAIPSARRAGQSIESLAGMFAFLTRNGLNVNMAASSAARALDALSNPKVSARLEAMGVPVKNLDGSFRQVADVTVDLGKKLQNLSDPERAAALQNLFKGAGSTIQARRFFDLAVRNFDQLKGLTDDMINSKGAMQAAYDIMFDQPATQSQLFKNNLDILKTEIGDVMIPIFNRWLKIGIKILQWFRNLSPHTKQLVIRIMAIASAAAIIIGVIMGVVGVFLIFQGAAMLLGTSLGVIFLGIIVVAALLAGAAYLIYRNWDTLKRWFEEYWPRIKKLAIDTWHTILKWAEAVKQWWIRNWPQIKQTAIDTWQTIVRWAKIAWAHIKQWAGNVWHVMQDVWDKVSKFAVDTWHLMQRVWDAITKFAVRTWHTVQKVWDSITNAAVDLWHTLQDIWDTITDAIVSAWQGFWDLFGDGFKKLGDAAGTFIAIFGDVWQALQRIFDGGSQIVQWLVSIWVAAAPLIGAAFDTLVEIFDTVWTAIVTIVKIALDWFNSVGLPLFRIFVTFLLIAWEAFKTGSKIIWDIVTGIINAAMTIIRGIIQVFLGIISLNWEQVWDGIKNVVKGIWDLIQIFVQAGIDTVKGIISTGIGLIKGIIESLDDVIDVVKGVWDNAKYSLVAVWDWIKDRIKSIIDWIKGAISSISDAIQGVIDKLNKIPVIGSLIPGKAMGGPVMGGQMYLVGEQGPELFMAPNNGYILPHNQTRDLFSGGSGTPVGGGVQIYNTFEFNGNVDKNTLPEVQRYIDDSMKRLEKQLIMTGRR